MIQYVNMVIFDWKEQSRTMIQFWFIKLFIHFAEMEDKSAQ